ncbi:MAG TPA: GHKL domain-containing protein [Ureibacillus sp.]|nr:GHKL domain-containing protein [Ureibacillus sp.]
MKKSKVRLIILISAVLLVCCYTFSFYATDKHFESTVKEAITSQALESAKAAAVKFDVDTYKKFLTNPEKNDYYWEISRQLNDVREDVGALFVYILEIDNPNQSHAMLLGLPPSKQEFFEIGSVCTLPKTEVSQAYYNETPYITDIIKDPEHGMYISVGTPIMDENNNILGFLAIDISTDKIAAINNTVQENNKFIFVSNSLFLLIVILSFSFLQRWYQREVQKEVENTEDTYQGEIQNLLGSVSSLRHDFTNHIQVIHGLLTIGESEKAMQYIDSLSNEVQLIESINTTVEHPGLAILLKSKKLAAQNHQIAMKTTVTEDSYEHIKTVDMIKILSNLIDNAIDATKELDEKQRKLIIFCDANDSHYIFKITNTGPEVGKKEDIFKRGFSTKQPKDGKIRGQGLFIVKQTVNKYNGEITIHSTNDNVTTATVTIPIK